MCDGVGLWNCSAAGVEVLISDDDGNRMFATKYLFLIRTIVCNVYGVQCRTWFRLSSDAWKALACK